MKKHGLITKDTPLYNSRTILNYYEMLAKKYPHIDLDDLRNYAGMRATEVSDPGHWFTQEQIDRFHAHLVKRTGNPNIGREAGQYLASSEALGPVKQYLISFLSPAGLFAMIGKITSYLTLTGVYTSRKINPNSVEVVVSYHEGVEEKEFQCQNRQGSMEAAVSIFNYSNQKIEHPECIFKGGKVCRYIISWEEKASTHFKKQIALLFIILCILEGTLLWTQGTTAFFTLLPWATVSLALLSWWSKHLEIKELRQHLKDFREPSNQLLDQIKSNYDHANTINEIGQAISAQTSLTEILQSVIELWKNDWITNGA